MKQLPLLDERGNVPKKPRKRTRGVALGRRPKVDRLGFVAHKTREAHESRHPVHVSMRRVKLAPSLRSERIFVAIVTQIAHAKAQGVRVVHHSVQHDHVHLIVEGQTREDLSNQMRKLFSRIARAVNVIAQRRGSLFRDRHHRVELTSPTQTRNALVYVLFNERKHALQNGGIDLWELDILDDRTSAAWLSSEDWASNARPPPEVVERQRRRFADSPVTPPETWLARIGWRQRGGGPIHLHELPHAR